jgi:enolase-phosphatase E1
VIRAVLTDIEGTTSSLSFVKDTLFPYARERMADFVREHGNNPEVRRELQAVSAETGRPLSDQEAVEQLIQWIDEDRKITPLKSLQGMIWEAGFHDGDFVGHIYEDAVEGLKRWHDAGLQLYIFSSGSVQAQKLLFGHTAFGDLTPLFSGYFDTKVGAKKEPESYRRIAKVIGLPPESIEFLSDIREELDAAKTAGMSTVWLVRDDEPDSSAAHRQVCNFDFR